MRAAVAGDLPAIVAMLADDALGAARESPGDPAPYESAFRRLAGDPNQLLAVAVRDGAVTGTLQLTIIPGLSRRGATRAQIEGVRVHSAARGAGIGEQMLAWAIEQARRRGCDLVQLTSDKTRAGAHRFYEKLGFTASHTGFKLPL
jgi:GNAT superfamily N-acetyltransferase